MSARIDIGPVAPRLRDLLAPGGIMRSGTNLSNFLLVTGRTDAGDPVGVSPDMARSFADCLGVGVTYVTYPSPGPLADAAAEDTWDIGLIGAEPQRARMIAFTEPYVEIEASYLVRGDAPFDTPQAVDMPGKRIAVTGRTAYALWLENNLRHAELVYAGNFDDALALFRDAGLDALAGLRSRLVTDERAMPGTRILPGRFMAVQQAIGVPIAKAEALPLVARFVKAARDGGLVAALIEKHGVHDLAVAKPG